VILKGLTCEVCGTQDLIAVEPGQAPLFLPVWPPGNAVVGNVVGTIVSHGRPPRAWCRRHWPWPKQLDLLANDLLSR
jgi:hypothetical protein